MSARRSPDLVHKLSIEAKGRGVNVIIAGAGAAAHLPSVVAAGTTRPVIGAPLPTSDVSKWDALLASVQMPAGILVTTMAVGKAGARNAGFLTAQIIGLSEPEFQDAYQRYRDEQAAAIRAESSL